MEVEFSGNAVARMAERGIAEAEVRAVLDAPDHLAPCLERFWHARKLLTGRRLEVVFMRDPQQTLVVTAYWQETAP
jgi:hypothetical protein